MCEEVGGGGVGECVGKCAGVWGERYVGCGER